jgi:carboxylesterase
MGDGPTGVLLVHGFQGSPQGMRGLGEFLSARGMTVAAPLLPGHGSTWQALNELKAPEWSAAVDDAFAALQKRCEELFVVGLSFGAALSLDTIARNPGAVSGLVTLAGWVYTNDPLRFFAPLLIKVVASLPPRSNDIADPNAHEIATDRFPARSGYEAYKLATGKGRAALREVDCPLLVMHGRNDHTIPLRSSEIIHAEAASADKELVILERSYHVITLDYDKDEVFNRTYEFIAKRAKHLAV